MMSKMVWPNLVIIFGNLFNFCFFCLPKMALQNAHGWRVRLFARYGLCNFGIAVLNGHAHPNLDLN